MGTFTRILKLKGNNLVSLSQHHTLKHVLQKHRVLTFFLFIMLSDLFFSVVSLLKRVNQPTMQQVEDAYDASICRCTGSDSRIPLAQWLERPLRVR